MLVKEKKRKEDTKIPDNLDLKQLIKILTAVKKGDFTVRMPDDYTGLSGKVADTLNDIIELNLRMTKELDRVSTVVGKEGKITQRASLGDARGSWMTCVDSVNTLIADLVQPTSEVARVITSVANGDLSQQMALEIENRPLTGEFLRTAKTVNTMVDQLSTFASEVTRVAREVGTEGKLGGQAQVKGVAGTWKDLTDSVNSMANNLTNQVRNIAEVTTAVATGDLNKKITVDAQGEILELKNTVNTMVDQLSTFASEVTRVAREVGTEGKLGGQAEVKGVGGTWKDLTDSVNMMASNLTGQVRDIAKVTTAVANGDLTKKVTVNVKGEILELKNTVNTMVDQLSTFSSEVTRVAREVGTEGKLGGQAEVKGVGGTWKDLTDSVNSMANNLTNQVRNIAEVTTAVATGDLNKKITVDAQGEILELKNTINTMVDQLSTFASEVTRVAREVGTEGKLGGQATVEGVGGTWKDLTDSVNMMASNLTGQVRNIAEVTTAVANGDLTKKITVDVKGEILDLKNTINIMVNQLSTFASEVTRVASEVGMEGKLGGQATVEGVGGTWKDLTDSVNSMANNLTNQVRNIAEVTTAVATGDLNKKITVDAQGEILELKNTINTMVVQLSTFASEVTRVAREVGTEGKLGGQATVEGVGGTWKDLTDSVNMMASNLTGQVRNIAEVTTAVANGDLTKKITVDVKGEILDLKNTINIMVDQLSTFASEVTRVAREVGMEGKLGGQAEVKDVAGTWKDLTDSVNMMATNLTNQVRDIAKVTTAVANGDLTKKVTVAVKGEILELKSTVNTMVDQLSTFASEVTRVAREVGTEGKLGGQAEVQGVSGTWKDLTDNVNSMASNLTAQVRNIAEVTISVAYGDLSKKITVDVRGEFLQLKETMNTMVDQLRSFASEVTRVAREVGTEGKLGGQAYVTGVAGTWKDLTDNVNFMASNLTAQVRNIATVTTAVANGDLTKKITVDVRGEILDLKNTINTMVDQLNSFASEVTRVAREVGTEGKLGGQAQVKGVSGTWKDLTDNVNSMAANLTGQVRGIVKVVTSVANGDLKQKLMVEAKGEIAQLAGTINSMIDTLATFADQVTTVAREVGVEGKLGGQAKVPGAAGTWRDLTDNVNQLAANLTTQVRAIAEVATAVTKGDLTRSIAVETQGELAILKDNINQMIGNLRDTTQKSTEQDWLKTNLAKFTRMLQGQRELETVSKLILSELAPLLSAQHGVFYLMDNIDDEMVLKLLSTYAYKERKNLSNKFRIGEGLIGQCVVEKERILVTDVPDDYIKINSGLGEAPPLNIIVLPVIFEQQVKAVIELASFHRFNEVHLTFLDQLTESIGIVLNTIAASMRTEELLKQSQSMADELRSQQQELTETNKRLELQAKSLQSSEELLKSQQEELQQTNEELQEKAKLLSVQNAEVERKNSEIELAKKSLEEKADQLSLTSKYKSEFLANMSHELRTPLNSMMILSNLLSENVEQNLSTKQIEFAKTIHSSGSDLLDLINEVLDLAKIESGTISIDLDEAFFTDIYEYVDRTFRQIAQSKTLDFEIKLDQKLPKAIYTDTKRLQQVLKNLLSNSFKFTEQGKVTLTIGVANKGWSTEHKTLNDVSSIIYFSVNDTGTGIPKEKQKIIFEAFQQVDGTTSRKYGGTGLGLSISREIAHLLGGEISLESEPDIGSTFTLFLPETYVPAKKSSKEFSPGDFIADLDKSRLLQSEELEDEEPFLIQQIFVNDDRKDIMEGDSVILIVEDDLKFANNILALARQKDFKGIISIHGEAALGLTQQYLPDAIILEIKLHEMDGWSVLDQLKHNSVTRHIPVYVILDDEAEPGLLKQGAITYIKKQSSDQEIEEALDKINDFINKDIKDLLVVSANDEQLKGIGELIGNGDVKITGVKSGEMAISELTTYKYDCVVIESELADMTGIDLIETLKDENSFRNLPIIMYSEREILPLEEAAIKDAAKTMVIKDVKSRERLLDETTLFLHRAEANLPEIQRNILQQLHHKDLVLSKSCILIVDDDVRNIFAITSLLERYDAKAIYAKTGNDGIELLKQNPDIDIVLMDIMMPEMDGYQTISAIREFEEFKTLPIIALTAKAMKGDREKCIEAGASDYISKPINNEQLLSLLRVWMYKN